MPLKKRGPALPPAPQTTLFPAQTPSPSQPEPSFLRRLSVTVPEHTKFVLERLLSPTKIQYSLPSNSSRGPYSTAATPAAAPYTRAKKHRRASLSIGTLSLKKKQAKVVETEVGALEKGRRGVAVERKGEFGVPLCREAEIEKWKLPQCRKVREGKRRKRFSWQ